MEIIPRSLKSRSADSIKADKAAAKLLALFPSLPAPSCGFSRQLLSKHTPTQACNVVEFLACSYWLVEAQSYELGMQRWSRPRSDHLCLVNNVK